MGPDAPILPRWRLRAQIVLGSGLSHLIAKPERLRNHCRSPALIFAYRSRGASRFELEHFMVRKALTITLIAGTMLLAACNTISGAGKDVKSAGGAVSDAAEGAK